MVSDGAEQGAAELIGKQLDFLNKELLRLQVKDKNLSQEMISLPHSISTLRRSVVYMLM